MASPSATTKWRYSAFSLSDMLAASGAAPAQTFQMMAGKLISSNFGFPEFRFGAVIGDDSTPTKLDGWKQNQFGDGGHLENSGVMSLLARKVKRILVFVNTQQPFRADSLTNHIDIDGNLVSLFQLPEYFAAQHSKTVGDSELSKIYHHYPHNGVFEGSQLGKLIQAFKTKDEKQEPLVFCDKTKVQKNDRYNISPYEATICWIYLQPSEKWFSSIKCTDDKCKDLKKRQGDFENFPNYKTFFNDFGHGRSAVIKTSVGQANALSQYTSWTVQQSVCEIRQALKLELPIDLSTDYLPSGYNSKCEKIMVRPKMAQ